ncbi:5'-methylthioadenosine/S-adenosylhomocysteine nucleosidase [Sphingobium sp. AP49]|uniref:5'-methylthioadenosine/S-adenosylhomocysteine nucleosidase n=1 Tax=Sphingobium sp. AP49 TaxID=1144307 RepID=UPI00026EE7F3|nr:5'-methylthioadenosine/S-adenosylhomocysteine nucleosidase [Sphingobium sp. AP49]WHO41209.1 5'-methylthioadenosine/S-adenosylhomocysteine nucleosidase [Sphingobium sp. AP49]
MTPQCVSMAGRQVLFVMAVQAEYGPHLQDRFVPLMTGVGPVEAAIATSITLDRMAQANALPDLVVSLGSAGSRIGTLGDVYQVASVAWRDMDASRLGFIKGVTPFVDHPVHLPLETPLELRALRLSTGADIVGGDGYAAIDAEMVDMETFAVARACARFGVPLMGLRGISDGPGELNDMLGWTQLLALIDERLAHAVDNLPQALAGWARAAE